MPDTTISNLPNASALTGAERVPMDQSGTTVDASAQAIANLAPDTDLSYTASTRTLASSTGVDAVLPLFTTSDAGLTPGSGGGTTNFLRADGTWAAPSGGSGWDGTTALDATVNGAASTPALKFSGTWFTGGTATTTKPQLLLEPSGGTSTNWSTSGTALGVNAPSGFTGNLTDWQINGVRTGGVWQNSGPAVAVTGANNFAYGISAFGFNVVLFGEVNYGDNPLNKQIAAFGVSGGPGAMSVGPSFEFQFRSSTATAGTIDTGMTRDSAGVIAIRRGTAAHTLRVYNTYTSSTNYERAKCEWDTNVFNFGTEKGSGGGTARDMHLQTDGTSRIEITASGGIIFNGLPTSDPTVAGQLWNDAGTLKVSAG